MKPLIFYDFEPAVNDPNNSITIKKNRLEEILQEVYDAGFKDGQKDKITWTPTPRTPGTPNGSPVPLNVPPTVKDIPITFENPYTQTCAALDDVSRVEHDRSIRNNAMKGSSE